MKEKDHSFRKHKFIGLNRRQFLGGVAGAALSFSVIPRRLVHGSQANSKIELGMIGCGGRGTWIADLFEKHGGFRIVAGADYFQDRVEAFGSRFQVDPKRLYTSLSCSQQLLSGGVDAVAIESPPFFHPEQAAAAVEAGCHVFLAKPVAVDVAGCQAIEAAGKRATEKKLVFLVDFQTRANPLFQEAVQRVHRGAIGEFTFGEASYHTGRLGIRSEPGTPEARLRNWVFFIGLSGDIITEQNIHALDVVSWILNEPPQRAAGTGGRKARVDVGDCWDHFALLYRYPRNVGITFSSRQYDDGGSPGGIRTKIFGTKGTIDTQYGGEVRIYGESPYAGGKTGNIYTEGAVANVAAFHQSILNGKFDNPTVAPSVRSNLVTIMGRTAAYEDREVTWDEVLRSDKKLEPDLRGLKA